MQNLFNSTNFRQSDYRCNSGASYSLNMDGPGILRDGDQEPLMEKKKYQRNTLQKFVLWIVVYIE